MCPQVVESSANDASEAAAYVRNLVRRQISDGGVRGAIRRVGRQAGIGEWTAWAFYHGRRKTAGRGVIARLRDLYLATCERELTRLADEIAIEKAKGRGDAALEDIAAKVAAFAVEVREARSR